MKPQLGMGVYTVGEVAELVGLDRNSVDRMFSRGGQLVPDYEPIDGEQPLSFRDLVAALRVSLLPPATTPQMNSRALCHENFWQAFPTYHSRMDFDGDGFVVRWRPAAGIVVDPAVCMGSPVIEGTGIAAHIIAAAVAALGGDCEAVANEYDLPVDAVRNAVAFCRRI